jgi:DNA-binding beta-propeller fold protein YncE
MKGLLAAIALITTTLAAHAQLMIAGNENKVELSTSKPRGIPNAGPDSVSILDFSTFPPKVTHVMGVSNSVAGPPSNMAITPDGKIALIASSIVLDPADPVKYLPDTTIHVMDLTLDPPKVIAELTGDKQPSGMSISKDGTFALVANRAAGTISWLSIDGKNVAVKKTVPVCKPEEEVVDVAISPDKKFAIASVSTGGYLLLLKIENGEVIPTERKFSAYGRPYRCLITPDGELALTAGGGQSAPDADALTIVDLKATPPRTIDYVTLGADPETIEISPDGKLLIAAVIDGSNKPDDSPYRTQKGKLVILERKNRTFVRIQELDTERIPEGIGFTPDGKYIAVPCFPAKTIWLYEFSNGKVKDTGARIDIPGFGASLRAQP